LSLCECEGHAEEPCEWAKTSGVLREERLVEKAIDVGRCAKESLNEIYEAGEIFNGPI
jgi:hypothetical protein